MIPMLHRALGCPRHLLAVKVLGTLPMKHQEELARAIEKQKRDEFDKGRREGRKDVIQRGRRG
jgi:hypothetical protein